MLLHCGVWRRLLRVPWTERRSNQSILKRSVLGVHWKDWCWSWNSNTLATWCKELTHWKRPWCWERLRAGGEGDDRGWDGWMASLTWWTWVWVDFGSWWLTGRPGVLRFMGLQRVGHDWVTELNSGILPSHRKEWNDAICNNMDSTRDCPTQWSESERQTLYDVTYIWNLISHKWIYQQNTDCSLKVLRKVNLKSSNFSFERARERKRERTISRKWLEL